MYSTFLSYLLLIFGGVFGLHRFYLGKPGTGLLYLFTGGFFTLGLIYDFFTLPGQVREANLRLGYRRALHLEDDYSMRQAVRKEISKDSIERIILKIAKRNEGIASPSEVALEGDITLDKAKEQLEKLNKKGFADVRVTRSGALVYVFNDFMTNRTEEKLEDF